MNQHRLCLRMCGVATFGAIALVIALGCVAAFLRAHIRPSLPYDGPSAATGLRGWQRLGGSWTLQNGVIRNDSNERGAKLLYGLAQWSDYSVSADVEQTSAGGDAGLIVRSGDEQLGSNAYSGYYAGLRVTGSQVVLGRARYGWLESRTVPFPARIQPGHWYHLVVAAEGCHVLVIVSDPSTGARASASLSGPPCFPRGRIGLRSYATEARWRSLRTAAISAASFSRLVAQGSPDQGGASIQQSTNAPARSFTQPAASLIVPIGGLRYTGGLNRQPVTVRGTVVLRRPVLTVQDASGGITLPGLNPDGFAFGDQLEATGIPQPDMFALRLQAARVVSVEPGRPLPPKSVTGIDAATGAYAGEYIELIGRVAGVTRQGTDTVLMIAADSQRFRVFIPPPSFGVSLPRIPEGSLVRVRGVEAINLPLAQHGTPFLLYLPDPQDVELLASPPWWSLQNMVWLVPVAIMLVLALLLLRVHERNMRLKAAMDERQRMGSELHDTLAQSFAGVGYQLQAVRTSLQRGRDDLGAHIESAIAMVQRSHQEARRSIASMQADLVDGEALTALLAEQARSMARGTSLCIISGTDGDAWPLPPLTVDVLFRTGQEAIANALRHAAPSKLQITLVFLKRSVRLVVADDGCGFHVPALQEGLGLRAARLRAKAAGAALHVESEPGRGTHISVQLNRRDRPHSPLRWIRRPGGHRDETKAGVER